MPYCVKCGVEVSNQEKACPLCDYPLPQLDVTLNPADFSQDQGKKFPKPVNMMDDMIRSTRNRIFYTLFILGVLTILITFTVSKLIPFETRIDNYIIIFTSSFLGYLFFLLGYGKSLNVGILGVALVSSYLALSLNYTIFNDFYFATYLLLPIIAFTSLVIIITASIYKKGKHKNHYIFVPIYACIDAAFIAIFIDLVTQKYYLDTFATTWSIVAAFSFLCFSFILTALYYKLPKQVKDRLVKFLHI